MKIALVHDFLKEYGGAERVLEALHEIWPEAPIYTAFVDYAGFGPHADRVRPWKIKTTWLQNVPFISQLYSPLRFLAPFAFRSLDLSKFDVIISSTNAYYAKGIKKRPPRGSSLQDHPRGDRSQIHICYCHTPPRSLYGYETAMNWRKNPIVRLYATVINHFLRMYDFTATQGVDHFIANSKEVQRRIKKFYRRESVVIYPPVELLDDRKSNVEDSILKIEGRSLINESYFLYVGKLAFAKHVDVAIQAANKLNVPLKVVGKGREEVRLRGIAHSNIEFLGEVNDEKLTELYKHCKAVIFPATDEDFGIVPVEAMSFGKPVIAQACGGVLETVIEGKTGLFFSEPKVESLVAVLKQFDTVKFNSLFIQKHAQKFSKERFKKEIIDFVERYA